MSENTQTLFLKWGDYKSQDNNKPDVIVAEIIDAEPFETQYDWNFFAIIDRNETNVPLRAKTSNKKLYKQYMSLLRKQRIKSGTKLVIKTWLGKSSKNPEYDLREFEVSL